MIGSGDDVDRLAPNPNRITQPFDEIGVDKRRTGGGLTKGQIIERLRGLERHGLYSEDGWGYDGIEPDKDGDYHRRDDILAIIKEAEGE